MAEIAIVLTTVGEGFDAHALAVDLVEQRLAACVNIVDRVTSVYRWQGRVTSDGEQLLVIKTVADQVGALRDALMTRHPYELPEFVVLRAASVSEAYAAWVFESTTAG